MRRHTGRAAAAGYLAAALLFLAAAPAAAQRGITMCSGQEVPEGYVVVGADRVQQCPGFWGGPINSYTITQPGDTVTVCSAQVPQLPGYVVTARSRMQQCPGYWGGPANTATYQRVSGGHRGDPRPHAPPALARLAEPERFLARQLALAEDWLSLEAPTHQVWTAPLRTGEAVYTRLELDPGERYTLVAVCDRECGDLDLRVVEAGSRVVAEDADPDAEPFIRLPPATAARWEVGVTMRQCAAARCRFSLAIHHTPTETDTRPRRPSVPPGSRRPHPAEPGAPRVVPPASP